MKLDAKLKAEISTVKTRLDVLTNRRKQLQQQIPTLEAKFLTEDSVGYEPLQQARLELITLDQSIDSIQGTLRRLREELTMSVSITEKEALIVSMRSAGQDAERYVQEYAAMIRAASEQIDAIGRSLALKRMEIAQARREFAGMQSEADEDAIHDAMIGLSPSELRTVREQKIRHECGDVAHYRELMLIEAVVLSRIDRESRANANTAA
jgi:uncharacterized protein (DUF342 family)